MDMSRGFGGANHEADYGAGEGADKKPNALLESWFVRSGWSKGELARQVNRRARQLGAVHVSTDTSRVRRWLDGEQPRDPIPRLLSALFSERFGCAVSVEDLGLRPVHQTPSTAGIDLPWTAPQTVALISEFSRSDLMLARRGFLGGSLALTAGAALIEPMQRWLQPAHGERLTTLADIATPNRTARRLSEPELALLESTTIMFRKWDAQSGGGLRRKAVVGQLHEVTDLLQEPQTAETGRRLFRVAAELGELAGWMSYDIGLQPAAQKYFVLALHAAKEAEDQPLGSYILSNMARQMIHLGRPDDALELIHLAQYGSRHEATGRTQAMLYAMEARAYANLAQPGKCKRAVRIAEDTYAEAIESAGEERDPDWIGFFTEAELHAENGHSFRDLVYTAGRPKEYAALAEPRIERAVELFGSDLQHHRSYALNLIGLSTVHLIKKEPELSAERAGAAIGIARKVRSERLNNRLRTTVDQVIRAYGAVPEVLHLRDEMARQLPEDGDAEV